MSKEHLIQRAIREWKMKPFIKKGYSRRVASKWCKRIRYDSRRYAKKGVSKNQIKKIHKSNFLCSTVEKYNISDINSSRYISDFDYLYLQPFNNSFEKWVHEIVFTNRMLKNHQDVCRNVYFTVIKRGNGHLILPVGGDRAECFVEDIISLLKKKGELEFRPAFWKSKYKRFNIKYDYKIKEIIVNNEQYSFNEFIELINSKEVIYIISDPVSISHEFGGKNLECIVKIWLANDIYPEGTVLSAELQNYWDEYTTNDDGEELIVRMHEAVCVDINTGEFVLGDEKYLIDRWKDIREKIVAISNDLKQLSYFTMSIALKDDCLFKIVSTSTKPDLPQWGLNYKLNNYLKQKVELKKQYEKITAEERKAAVMNSMKNKLINKFCRRGVRSYMQKLWFDALKDDWKNTKDITITKKIWAHRRGFFSFRIRQYGLNKKNYKKYLSDYDYFWLNRINNSYQKQINDKTTYRYIMEPFKEYIPQYFFSVIRRNGQVELIAMPDCPEDIESNINGVIKLLKRRQNLAFKASAGTHGDGFYCLAYDDNNFLINDKVCTEEEIKKLINSIKSFYIITDFLYMHDELRKIYDKTVNTVRVMVINKHGYDPKIMQTYIRIGSSKTGYTDNVGYGGICAMIDIETGEIYNPEVINNHVFYKCPVHPDSGVLIEGAVPCWESTCKLVLDVSRYLCELEYLGFDVAITDKGVKILEINIHQDLHKVADHTDEIKDFYKEKIEQKHALYYTPSKWK